MDGGHLGAWGVSPHTCTCMHMHAYMHARTFIHVQKLQMAADMEASMFSMFNMHVRACIACVCMCACMRTCMGHPPTHPCPLTIPIHPSATSRRGVDPQNHLKFDNTSTYQDISIPFEDLKSVKNSTPMGGCVVWWVRGWLGGLMGGIRSNH